MLRMASRQCTPSGKAPIAYLLWIKNNRFLPF
nr:MAG TPA: hypothetical protein [Caudoviricetes sp.]